MKEEEQDKVRVSARVRIRVSIRVSIRVRLREGEQNKKPYNREL